MQAMRAILGSLAVAVAVASAAGSATAQSDICDRLEAQLAAIDSGAGMSSAGSNAQLDRAIGERAQTLNALRMEHARTGCRRSGFLFFQPRRPAACSAIEARIHGTETELRRLQAEREQSAGRHVAGGDAARRQILLALTRHGCGGGYARDRRNTVFGMLYGERTRDSYGRGYESGMPGGAYRTLCVRSCDGYYWPISFSTTPTRFGDDATACAASCPGADVSLYVHRNPGEGMDEAVSLSGAPYSALPTAFRYRKEFDSTCACRRPAQLAARIEPAGGAPLPVASFAEETETVANVPLPRPRPGIEAPSPDEPAEAEREEPPAAATETTVSRDGRPVRVVGPGFTYYRTGDE